MEDLPQEILEHILSLLSTGDRLNCASVCKRWQQLLSAPRFLDDVELVLRIGNVNKAMEVVRDTKRSFISLRIENGTLYDFNEDFWKSVGRHLLDLHLSDCDLSALVFYRTLELCPQLKTLNVTGCSSLMMSDSLLSPPKDVSMDDMKTSLKNVRHLNLAHNRFLTDASFHQMLSLMPAMNSLSLSGCSNLQFHPGIFRRFCAGSVEFSSSVLTFQNVLACMMHSKNDFVELDFSKTLINSKAIEQLVQLYGEHLQKLTLNVCDQLTAKAYECVAECTKLKKLSLQGTCQTKDVHLSNILGKTVNLEHLDVSGCYQLTDLTCDFITRLEHLRFLSLFSCTSMSNQAFCGLQKLRNLRHLDLSFTHCDASVFEALKSLTELRSLILVNCKELDSRCFELVCDNFKKLRTLSLEYCLTLSNEAALSFHELRRLRELVLTGAVDITDAVFEHGIGSRDMKILKLGLASQLTDSAMVSIADHHKGIEVLDLSGCSKITDVGLISLVQCLPRLRVLLLKGCRFITDRSLEALQSHCPHLRRLVVEQGGMTIDKIDLFAHLRPTVDVN